MNKAYQKAYGIRCRSGWDYLLPSIQDLDPPQADRTVEERLEKLERSVASILTKLGMATGDR